MHDKNGKRIGKDIMATPDDAFYIGGKANTALNPEWKRFVGAK